MAIFKGAGVAIVTPMKENFEVKRAIGRKKASLRNWKRSLTSRSRGERTRL